VWECKNVSVLGTLDGQKYMPVRHIACRAAACLWVEKKRLLVAWTKDSGICAGRRWSNINILIEVTTYIERQIFLFSLDYILSYHAICLLHARALRKVILAFCHVTQQDFTKNPPLL
jgi:hypothetical protein